MKFFPKIFLSSLTLFHATTLFAMDPMFPVAFGKGAEALEGELGVFGKKAISSKTPITTTEVVCSPVGNSVFSSSSAASAMVLSQRVVEATAVSVDDSTIGEHSTAQFLEKEICDNIYLSCLAKVATMSFAERTSVEGILNLSQEAREWAAAEQEAIRDVEKSQQVLEAATDEKKIADKEIKMMLDDSTFHGGTIVAKAYHDFKVKELSENLAKVQVVTAKATLYAIRVKNTAKSAGAETDLNEAIAAEKKALQVLEETKSHAIESVSIPMAEAIAVEAVAVYPDNYSYQAYPHNQQFNPLNLSPERAAQEEQKTLAKKEKATAAFEQEFSMMIESSKLQAEETAGMATEAREKAEKSGTSEKAWKEALEEAEMTGEAYTHLAGLYEMYKEQAAEHYEGGMLKTKYSKYNFELKKAEKKKEHWTTEAEECSQKKEALKRGTLEKSLVQERTAEMQVAKEREVFLAQQAKEHEEFKAQEKMKQIKLEAEAVILREREALERGRKQKEDEANLLAKQKELEKEKEIVLHKQALAQREEAAKRLEAEAAAQAKTLVEESKAIAASEALVNLDDLSVECATGSTNHQHDFNDASCSKSLLSSPTAVAVSPLTAYSLQPIASIRPIGLIGTIEADKKLIETWTTMKKEMKEKEKRANAAGNTEEGEIWRRAGNALSGAAINLEKVIKGESESKSEEAQKWREAAEQKARVGEFLIEAARAYGQGKEKEGENWHNAGLQFHFAVIALEKAIEAESFGKSEEALTYRNEAEQKKPTAELYTKAAKAYAAGKTTEGNCWENAAYALNNAVYKQEEVIKAEARGSVAEAQILREEVAEYKQKVKEQQWAAERLQGRDVNAAVDNIAQEESLLRIETDRTLIETWRTMIQEMGEKMKRVNNVGYTDEGGGWRDASNNLRNAADNLEKAIEFERKGNLEVAQKWREVVEHNKCCSDLFSEAARAYNVGKTEEGKIWNQTGQFFYYAARNLEKAIEAESSGKPEEALKWREAVEQRKHAGELYAQSARAYAAGKIAEGKSRNDVGNAFKNVAKKLEQAIGAEARGKAAEAQYLREEAAEDQKEAEEYQREAEAIAQEL